MAHGETGKVTNGKVFDGLYLSAQDRLHPQCIQPPVLDHVQVLRDGKLLPWAGKTVDIHSPIVDLQTGKPVHLGKSAMMTPEDSLKALESAAKAYNSGRGFWPTCAPNHRVECLERFVLELKSQRDLIARLLMWEICKVQADAEKEVDRTIQYIRETIKEYKALENRESTFVNDGGIFAQIRRAPLGIVLCLGPFNYPFNETYATLIPAILMGNTVVMKLPRVGVLCHAPTLEMFARCFPPGVVNVIAGSGRETMPPLMKTGQIDCFAFIGTSKAADELQKVHPKPHRLRVCLGLEAKNPAIVCADADINVAVDECVLGSLSFNGQRCTAIKIIFVHKSLETKFLDAFVKKVDSLKMALPWQDGAKITPLPEEGKPGYLKELIEDALAKGAKVINPRGNEFDRTFVAPTVLFPTNKTMRVFNEEQFGPLVPVATFENLDEILDYLAASDYGQQASVFANDPKSISALADVLVNQVARVNLNSQCQRGPDSFPFTGRKDSAYGTLSIGDALRVFSIRAMVAGKSEPKNQALVNQIVCERSSNFLRLDYMF
jgi:glyceraldehyde-3-phosphate dehydrogenase (NADP+)